MLASQPQIVFYSMVAVGLSVVFYARRREVDPSGVVSKRGNANPRVPRNTLHPGLFKLDPSGVQAGSDSGSGR